MQRLKEKSFAPAGDPTPVVQSVIRQYTYLTGLTLFFYLLSTFA
jgi:hypothetical protein